MEISLVLHKTWDELNAVAVTDTKVEDGQPVDFTIFRKTALMLAQMQYFGNLAFAKDVLRWAAEVTSSTRYSSSCTVPFYQARTASAFAWDKTKNFRTE
jgi:hypothetical protein